MEFKSNGFIFLVCFISGQTNIVQAHYEEKSQVKPGLKQMTKRSTKKSTESEITHKATADFDPWKLLEMAMSPAYASSSQVHITLEGGYRYVRSNGLPDHTTGAFPNSGNPNTIREQSYSFRMPASPSEAGHTTSLHMNLFGVAINGVPFDPGAAEWWNNDPSSGWQYEAMSLGPKLGLDQNNAHVQPNGAYHYRGIPTGLLDELSRAAKPVLLGYAADGFPIYAPYGHSNPKDPHSSLKKLRASYRIKYGSRNNGPQGSYDGLFTEDYEYVKGLGDLDDCNGRFAVTTEYPQGTYHYVITDSFPYIPRGFKGTPDATFFKRRGGASGRGPGPGGRGPERGAGGGHDGQRRGPGFGRPPGGPGFGEEPPFDRSPGGRPPGGGPPPFDDG